MIKTTHGIESIRSIELNKIRLNEQMVSFIFAFKMNDIKTLREVKNG